MSSETQEPHPLVRFCDAFFQEKNIKWLLGLGTLILVSSSTMLVNSHWDTYPPLWKYAIFVGYTAIFHVAGQFAYHRLALKKTGTGLMALTVILIPLSFAALRWIHPAQILSIDGLNLHWGFHLLYIGNILFSYQAAQRIFGHFLVKPQPTFSFCYLSLAIMGSIAPSFSTSWAMLSAFLAWGLFLIGSIKVNRHAFWLAEEYRKPRIFGFFPIFLLGAQFLILFGSCFASNLSSDVLGLGLVLTSIPILLASDALIKVVEVRSLEKDPKIPASVVLSWLVGVLMVIGGVFLSGQQFPQRATLVPTALLAAVLMGTLAFRTHNKSFSWLTILFGVVVYQASPVFFKELMLRVADQGAELVGEEKIPFAFYGLTYLPLLIGTSLLAKAAKPKWENLFSIPLTHFSIGLPLVLGPVAAFHDKALFPVLCSLGLLQVWQMFLFEDRRLQFTAQLAFLGGVYGFPIFANAVWGAPNTFASVLYTCLIASILHVIPGELIDRKARLLPKLNSFWNIQNVFQASSMMITVVCTLAWIAMAIASTASPVAGLICFCLLLWHACRTRNQLICTLTISLPVVLTLAMTAKQGWQFPDQISVITFWLVAISLLGKLLKAHPAWFLTSVFQHSTERVATWGVVVLQLILIPTLMLTSFGSAQLTLWVAAIICMSTNAELAWRTKSPWLTTLFWISGLAFTGNVYCLFDVTSDRFTRLPALWATQSVLTVAVIQLFQAHLRPQVVHQYIVTLEKCSAVTLGVIAVWGLPYFSGPLKLASLLAIPGIYLLKKQGNTRRVHDALFGLLNFHLLTFVMTWTNTSPLHLFNLDFNHLLISSVPLAITFALSSIFWEYRYSQSNLLTEQLPEVLRACSWISLFLSIFIIHQEDYFALLMTVIVTFVILISAHTRRTVAEANDSLEGTVTTETAKRVERNVWLAALQLCAAMVYLTLTNVIIWNTTLLLYVPLCAAFTLWLIASYATHHRAHISLTRPLRISAQILPAFTIIIGSLQFAAGTTVYWPGVNSLALLFASAFYFWIGLEEKRPTRLIGSAVSLNVALAILWSELSWHDPQLFLIPVGISSLFLVEFLKERIPTALHNPLRYASALTILVSPTFEIVGGSWLHLLSLMVTSVVVVITAMGLRIKALMYTGSAFLIADLITIVVRGTIDQPSLLWLAGIAVGISVIAFAAYCEKNREKMLQRLRILSAELESWN